MSLSIQEILALKQDLFTLEENEQLNQVVIHCKMVNPNNVDIHLEMGELIVKANNDDIIDQKSIFLGFDVELESNAIKGQTIFLTFKESE